MSTDTTRPAAACLERFTQIPDGLHELVASPREFQLIAALLSHRWTPDAQMFPSVKRLAEILNCSQRTVQRTCAALEARGLLVREYRHREDEGQTSNIYHLAGALLALVGVVVDTRLSPGRRTPLTRPSSERHSGKRHTRTRGRESVSPATSSPYGLLTRRNGVVVRE